MSLVTSFDYVDKIQMRCKPAFGGRRWKGERRRDERLVKEKESQEYKPNYGSQPNMEEERRRVSGEK